PRTGSIGFLIVDAALFAVMGSWPRELWHRSRYDMLGSLRVMASEEIPRERCDEAPLKPSADRDLRRRGGDAARTAGARLSVDDMDDYRPRRARLPLAAAAPGLGGARARPPYPFPLAPAHRLPPASV